MDVATVVALRGGRVLLVVQPAGGPPALPGGKLEAAEPARAAAARELREETGIAVPSERLIDLGLRIALPDGPTLIPFALVDPPRPRGQGELRRCWIDVERVGVVRTAPGVAQSVHRALARAGLPQPVPEGRTT